MKTPCFGANNVFGVDQWGLHSYTPHRNSLFPTGLFSWDKKGLKMANTLQSKKRIRRNDARQLVNKSRTSRVRTFVKAVETAIEAGDQKAAQEALRLAQPEIQRGAQKGMVHAKTASRKISRLSARVKSLAS